MRQTEIMSNPPRETEVKIRWTGTAEQAQAHIKGCGYAVREPRALQVDQLFDRGPNVDDGELRRTGCALRLRQTLSPSDRSHLQLAIVTYKGPAEGSRWNTKYKSREEIEFDVSNAEAYVTVLSRLGYWPSFRYEKYRTVFGQSQQPGIITLDETPIGVFLELEGPENGAGEWIDSTAKRLGFGTEDYITASYAALYMKYREGDPDASKNMVFGTHK